MRKLIVLGLSVLCLMSSCSKTDDVKKVLLATKLTAPADKSTITENTVDLTWEKNADETATYDVYFGTTAVITSSDLKETATTATSLTVEDLKGSTTYFWKVIVKNEDGLVTDSEVFSFAVGNALPTKPELTFPANDTKLAKTALNLVWAESTDADGDDIVYDVYFSKSETFTADDVEPNLTVTKIVLENLDVSTKYFWKVVAKDTNGGVVESDVFNFTTHTIPNAQLLSPVDEYLGEVPAKFTWEAEEGFKYSVLCGKTNGFTAADMIAKDIAIGECPFPVEKLESNVKYFWQVIAINEAGSQFTSPVFSFTIEKTIAGPTYGEFIDSRDSHVYKTVEIDGVVWLAENLAFIPAADAKFEWMIPGEGPTKVVGGVKVPNPAYDDVKGNANYKKHGILYNVASANVAVPAGWHIATDQEWVAMEIYVGMAEADKDLSSYRGSHAKTLKKEDGGWGQEATNESGFSAIPSGLGAPDWNDIPKPKVVDFETKAWFWTGTSKGTKNYYRMIINQGGEAMFEGVKKGLETNSRRMSVRLIKD